MGFQEAITHLDSLGIDAMKSLKPSLHRIEALCEALAHPERAVPAIHITGTNGKTSTARIAASLLGATGIKVGAYTSPHLQSVRERLAHNGEPIGENEFGDVFDYIWPYVELVEAAGGEQMSFFELLTGMFFVWAADSCDAIVVEVGLGGRWDATNVVDAPVAVITNISLDHMGLLGSDRPTIAREKAGIIKPGSSVVTADLSPDVLDVIGDEAKAQEATLARYERDFVVTDNRIAFGGRYLSIRTSERSYEGLFLPLHGAHQSVNAATALESVVTFLPSGSIDADVVAEGFASVSVPGRLESLHGGEGDPVIVLDVAHNPDGMSALVRSLVEAFAFERAVFVVGILGDKDYKGMLAELVRIPCTLVATEAKSVRSVTPDEIAGAAEELGLQCEIVEEISAALQRALALAGTSDLVCVTGSHYVVGEARTTLVGEQ